VFFTLKRVHDQERAACVAPLFPPGRANLMFLTPAQATDKSIQIAHDWYRWDTGGCSSFKNIRSSIDRKQALSVDPA